MTIDEIKNLDLEAIEKRVAEIRTELESADTATIDALDAELKAIEERKKELAQEIEQRKNNMSEVIKNINSVVVEKFEERGNRNMANVEIRNTPEYIEAYANYVKTGNDVECRKLTTELDTTPNGTGTVAVPEFVYDIVKTAWDKEGIMSLVRKTYLKGTLKVQFEISGDDAQTHAEGASAVSEENLVLGIVSLTPISIKKWISISDEVYDLRGEQFLRYIYDELAYRIAKKAADLLIAKIEACGTVSTTTCPGVPKLQDNPALDTIAQALGKLSDEAANPVIIMNKATWSAFKSVQYAGAYPIDPFEGLDVVFNNSVRAYSAATTGVTYAIVGDLGHGAIANFPNGEGIDFKFDEMSQKKLDLIEVLGREYVGLGVVAPGAFVKVVKEA